MRTRIDRTPSNGFCFFLFIYSHNRLAYFSDLNSSLFDVCERCLCAIVSAAWNELMIIMCVSDRSCLLALFIQFLFTWYFYSTFLSIFRTLSLCISWLQTRKMSIDSDYIIIIIINHCISIWCSLIQCVKSEQTILTLFRSKCSMFNKIKLKMSSVRWSSMDFFLLLLLLTAFNVIYLIIICLLTWICIVFCLSFRHLNCSTFYEKW